MVMRAHEAGAADFLCKPVSREAVLELRRHAHAHRDTGRSREPSDGAAGARGAGSPVAEGAGKRGEEAGTSSSQGTGEMGGGIARAWAACGMGCE